MRRYVGAIFLYIVVISLVLRLINLNYNSPHPDEAIYQVIGLLGVFERDWGTLNASTWMAGDAHLYPSISGISAQIGGVLASRLFNIMLGIFSLFYVYRITEILTPTKKYRYLAGLIATFLVGVSAVSIYVSRLATYDMPSFFLAVAGSERLLAASLHSKDGKVFFQASLMLFLSVVFKIITGPFVALLVICSYIYNRGNKKVFYYWKRYLAMPLLIFGVFYTLINLQSYIAYLGSQVGREYISTLTILSETAKYLGIYLLVLVAGVIKMLRDGNSKLLLMLIGLSSVTLMTHIVTHRLATLDKHIYLSIVPISIIFAVGFAGITTRLKRKFGHYAVWSLACLLILVYEIVQVSTFTDWNNSTELVNYLQARVVNGEKILSQEGPPVMLGVYNQNFPANVTTFDWFQYRGNEDITSYGEAVRDGYFKYIELQPNEDWDETRKREIIDEVEESMGDIYSLAYEGNGFYLYERNY